MSAADALAVAEREAADALTAYEAAREAFEDAEADWDRANAAMLHYRAMAAHGMAVAE